MSLPCHECPVLAMCFIKFKGSTVICDIVWKYIVQDTKHEKILPGPIRNERYNEANKLFSASDYSPEDESDLL